MSIFEYNVEKKKVEEAKKQLYRDFALKYSEIKNSELSESEKQAQIIELLANTSSTERILKNTTSLDEISLEDREYLGIKELNEPTNVDTNVVDTLVSIYAKRLKMPKHSLGGFGIAGRLTLDENEELEEIDTSAFEEELRQYFTEHYYDLLSDGFNNFLSNVTEVADEERISYKKNGELTEIAIRHGLDPKKLSHFGYQLTVQDGLVAEEDKTLGRCNIFYGTPNAINQRIFDLYSENLFNEQQNNGEIFVLRDGDRILKNVYITYAEKNGIQIEKPEVLETLEVDMDKVQALSKYVNRVINSKERIQKGDYSQVFSDDIIKNYSKIMNLQWYNFGNLESVKSIVGEHSFIDALHLNIEEDNISRPNDSRPDIAWGTPEFVREEYQKIMQQVEALHQTNAFQEKYFDVEKITAKKQAYRRYIQENEIEGIDTSIPKVGIDHDRTGMIADSIMEEYCKEYEDKENMRSRILAKLEDNWAEIITEAQVMDVKKLFGEELKEMGQQDPNEYLYIKDDFVYLGDFSAVTSKVIYATPEALRNNIQFLDNKIASNNLCFIEKRMRESLVKYAQEHEFDLDIPSVESVENRGKQEREMFSFNGGMGRFWDTEIIPDDPTARAKIDLNDGILAIITKMSEENPGAIVGLTNLLKADKTGGMLLLSLDDMNIRGSQVWKAYKYLYKEDAEKFANAVHKRDKKMVDFINEELAAVGDEKAVTGGASFDRNKYPGRYRFTQEEVDQLREQRVERIAKEKEQFEKMIANSPAKKNRGAKKRQERELKKQEYRQALISKGKRSLGELDEELTDLQEREKQAKELYEKYEKQKDDKESSNPSL